MKRLLMAFAMSGLSACAWPHPNLDQGRETCDIDSIATVRQRAFDTEDQLRASGGSETRKTDLDKMKKFSADIDAQYRTTVAACQAYMACMDRNNYDTRRCTELEIRWQNSEDTFLKLSKSFRAGPPATANQLKPPGPPPGRGGPLPPLPPISVAPPFTAPNTDP